MESNGSVHTVTPDALRCGAASCGMLRVVFAAYRKTPHRNAAHHTATHRIRCERTLFSQNRAYCTPGQWSHVLLTVELARDPTYDGQRVL